MPKYYILTADTSRSPSYDGVSTRVQLIGPFDYIEYVQTFISDSSMPLAAGYRIVELEDATIPVVDPRSISEENKITGRYGEKGVCDQPVPDADIPVAAPRPTWSIVSPGVLQFGNTKFRITFGADDAAARRLLGWKALSSHAGSHVPHVSEIGGRTVRQ
jgi:hypothetical protein